MMNGVGWALAMARMLRHRSIDRDYDMYMLGLQNAQERTKDDWAALLKGTDAGFKITRVLKPARSYLAIVEVTWEG